VTRHGARSESAVRGTSLFVLVAAAWRLAGRAFLLAFWSAVLWGTLLLLSMAFGALAEGPGAVLPRVDPRGRPGLVPWMNAACVLLAPLTWLSVALFLVGGKAPKPSVE
jgi:hypothetical protein